MIGDDGRAAHLARQLTRISWSRSSLPRSQDPRVGDGQGRQGRALAFRVHACLPQKKSDSQPMRRPVTFPKVPVAACREEPKPCPLLLRYPHSTRPTAVE
jgi:hypothetical protein